MDQGPNPKSTASIAGHPLHPMLIPFPVAFFVTTLVTDIAYLKTANPMWFTASTWLVGAGVVMGLVAALAGFTDFFGSGQIRALKAVWRHMIGNLLAVALSAVNFWIHYQGGSSNLCLTLSAVVVLILLYTGWQGWEMVYRHRVGVAD